MSTKTKLWKLLLRPAVGIPSLIVQWPARVFHTYLLRMIVKQAYCSFAVLSIFVLQRTLLYNTYATRAMCDAGVNVLDVFPLSDSYPNGTGLVNKDYDAVHYNNWVFQAVIDFLERYKGGS